jgi:hypothetical protein
MRDDLGNLAWLNAVVEREAYQVAPAARGVVVHCRRYL